MEFYRFGTDIQPTRYLFIAETFGEEFQDLLLAPSDVR